MPNFIHLFEFFKEKLRHHPKTAEQSWTGYYEENEPLFGTLVFLGGFLFDVVTLSDVDDTLSLVQQIIYLTLIGGFTFLETLEYVKTWQVPRWFGKIWVIREFVLHFLLGSLLSLYSLFFFKSASLSTSLLFMVAMATLLVANEFPQLQKRGPIVRWALWFLCLLSFLQIVMPILFGYVGFFPFLAAWFLVALKLAGIWWLLTGGFQRLQQAAKELLVPSVLTLLAVFVLYLLKAVPPVPIVLKDIGIYHLVEKVGDKYVVHSQTPRWRFWHHGDQDFVARPGDSVFVYFAISSPARIQDQVHVRWLYDDPKQGWTTSDAQPISIRGGRGEGYRGFAFKRNFQDGDWRVQIETGDEREVGRLNFSVRHASESDLAPPVEIIESK